MTRSFLASGLTLLTAVAACSDGVSPYYVGGDFTFEVVVDTLTRGFAVHVPEGLNPKEPAPLLFAFHGTGQDGEDLRNYSELSRFADPAGFITVYPEAYAIGTLRSWAIPLAPSAEAGVDDIAFVDRVIDLVSAEFNIDEERVFAAGLSTGAAFTQMVACRLDDRFAGFASVAATLYVQVSQNCGVGNPMPALYFLGTKDPIYRWDGVVGEDFAFLSAEASAAFFATRNACAFPPTIEEIPDVVPQDSTTVQRYRWTDCRAGVKVLLYSVIGGSHTWPGSRFEAPILGCTTRDIHASQLMIDFFLTRGTVPPPNSAAGNAESRGCEKPFQ